MLFLSDNSKVAWLDAWLDLPGAVVVFDLGTFSDWPKRTGRSAIVYGKRDS